MKIIFGLFRNATRDVKLTDSTIGGKGGGNNCNDGFLCTGFYWKAQSTKRFLTNLNSQGCELLTSWPFFSFLWKNHRSSVTIVPAISGNTVVWEDRRDGNLQIFAIILDGPEVARCTSKLTGDINGDCKVDFDDQAIMLSQWLEYNLEPKEACPSI